MLSFVDAEAGEFSAPSLGDGDEAEVVPDVLPVGALLLLD